MNDNTPQLLSEEQLAEIKERNDKFLGPNYADYAIDSDHFLREALGHISAQQLAFDEYRGQVKGVLQRLWDGPVRWTDSNAAAADIANELGITLD